MGKRKRIVDPNKTPPPPVFMLHASQMESSPQEKLSHSFGASGVKPMSSLVNILEKSPNGYHQHAPAHHRHHNLNRALLLKLPRHYYNIQHSQRSSGGTATSHGKITPLPDDRLPFKFGHRSASGTGYYPDRREKAFRKQDRIRSSSLAIDAFSPDVMKMLCGLCQKMLKRKPFVHGNAMSTPEDLSVVAVLVCGHVYHADCLETTTSIEDRRDPPCPLCTPTHE